MIMDDMEINPDKYKGKKLSELTDDEEFNEENSVQYTQDYYKDSLLPKTIMVSTLFYTDHFVKFWFIIFFFILFFIMNQNVSVKDLDLEAAFEERQVGYNL